MKAKHKRAVCFHGTSADNLTAIIAGGLSASESKLWNCSHDAVYLWSAEAVAKAEDIDNAEDAEAVARQRAIESGQFACAKSKDCRIVVARVMVDANELEDDDSCPNMAGSGAVCIRRDVPLKEVDTVEVSGDLSLLRGYFAAMTLDREESAIQLDNLEEKIARAISKAEIYPEDVDELIEMEPVTINK